MPLFYERIFIGHWLADTTMERLLVQVGLLKPAGLPVTGAEQADYLLAPRTIPASAAISRRVGRELGQDALVLRSVGSAVLQAMVAVQPARDGWGVV